MKKAKINRIGTRSTLTILTAFVLFALFSFMFSSCKACKNKPSGRGGDTKNSTDGKVVDGGGSTNNTNSTSNLSGGNNALDPSDISSYGVNSNSMPKSPDEEPIDRKVVEKIVVGDSGDVDPRQFEEMKRKVQDAVDEVGRALTAKQMRELQYETVRIYNDFSSWQQAGEELEAGKKLIRDAGAANENDRSNINPRLKGMLKDVNRMVDTANLTKKNLGFVTDCVSTLNETQALDLSPASKAMLQDTMSKVTAGVEEISNTYKDAIRAIIVTSEYAMRTWHIIRGYSKSAPGLYALAYAEYARCAVAYVEWQAVLNNKYKEVAGAVNAQNLLGTVTINAQLVTAQAANYPHDQTKKKDNDDVQDAIRRIKVVLGIA